MHIAASIIIGMLSIFEDNGCLFDCRRWQQVCFVCCIVDRGEVIFDNRDRTAVRVVAVGVVINEASVAADDFTADGRAVYRAVVPGTITNLSDPFALSVDFGNGHLDASLSSGRTYAMQ